MSSHEGGGKVNATTGATNNAAIYAKAPKRPGTTRKNTPLP